MRNWFLIIQPDNYLQFTKVGTRKGMDIIWALDKYNIFVYALFYALIYLSTYAKERKALLKFLH